MRTARIRMHGDVRERQCSACLVWKPEDAENYHRHSTHGFQCRCKGCNCAAAALAYALRGTLTPSTKPRPQPAMRYRPATPGMFEAAEQIVQRTRSAAEALHAITDSWPHAWERGPI